MGNSKITLGIDLGTQSVKVLFYDFESHEVVDTATSELELDQDTFGKAEQRTNWWTASLCRALADVSDEIKRAVTAVAVSGQQHGFVPLDGAGEVLAPVKLWCDTSTEAECSEIMQRLGGEDACVAVSGNKILPGFTASKVLNLKKARPDLYTRLHTILLPHDYLNFWLTGQRWMEMGDASGTGFLDIRKRRWSNEVLKAIDSDRDLSRCLPPLRTANEFIGSITSEAASQTGLPEGVPVAIGGGDNMMGAIGTGNLAPGRTTISLGTSGTIYAYSDKPIIDRAGNVSAFCSSTGGWLPLLCTMNCTVTSDIVRSLVNVSLDGFDERLASVPIGSEGVITLPFFNGERTPNLPNAKGVILGLDSNNATSQNLLRSGIEGASFALRFGLDELKRLGLSTEEIVVTGGGANSAVWRQMMADIMGVPVLVMRNNEGAAFGAALQAYAARLGCECSIELLSDNYQIDHQLSCNPNQQAVKKYQNSYLQYRQAVAKLSDLYC